MLKILAVLVLLVAAYCQDNHHHTISLKSVVTHAVPKKIHYHYHESEEEATPFYNDFEQVFASPKSYSQAVSSQNSVHYNSNENSLNLIVPQTPFVNPHVPPSKPAPVYESQEPVRAPVHLKIIPPKVPHAQHRVLQLVHQVPIKSQVIHVPSLVPTHHSAPIAPIIYQQANAPLVHHTAIAPVIRPVAILPIQPAPIQYNTVEAHHAPGHQYTDKNIHLEPIQHNYAEDAPESHYEETHYKATHHKSHHDDSHHEHGHGNHVDYDYYAYPKYEFAYEVKDTHTQDLKYQHESRDGDVVKGVYSLQEPDGSIRTVKYGSDKKSGFNAEITHKGHSKHIVPHHYHH